MTQTEQPSRLNDSSVRKHGLSKSRLTSFEQCPKRLWLQVHRREEGKVDSGVELRFAAGHEVGALACSFHPEGIMIEAEPDMAAAIVRTTKLLESADNVPLFEATFVHEGVLVRVDVMEPDGQGAWHVAEVKSSTSRKDYHLADLATQLWVMQENGVEISSAAIRHIDNQFTLAEEGEYTGLLKDTASLEDAHPHIATRAVIAAAARDVLAGPEPEVTIGDQCTSPFLCEFREYCSRGSSQPEWPISLLPNTGKKVAGIWAEQGVTELTQVPDGGLANAVHARIHQATCTNEAFHDVAGAQKATSGWGWPRSYLDFETIAFVIPRWIGTRSWQQVPFQFSLHIEQKDGRLDHEEFLSIDGKDPRRACAEALISMIPSEGAIIAYNAGFERGCIKQLADLFPDLEPALSALSARIVDLLPVTRNHWYHRDQRGSWSIKAVLPTISTMPGYKDLAVQDGTSAQTAYLEAIAPDCDPGRRSAIARDLKDYCALDTLAMVELLGHLTMQRSAA